jgi:ribosomal RNA assembly protein
MRNIAVQNMNKIKRAVPTIEGKIKIKVSLGKGYVVLRGSELDEFLGEKIIQAVDFGFHVDDALLLKGEKFTLEYIKVRENTHRKNLRDVRARLIGTDGKARKTIENLTGAVIVIHDNEVGVIVDDIHLEAVTQGIESLIHGAKHGNVFAYLEKQNIAHSRFDDDDLGLRDGFEED